MPANVSINVEFYGIPRLRAGRPTVTVWLAPPATVGDVIRELEGRFPKLAEECLGAGQLNSGYCASLEGDRFVGPDEPLSEGATLLILSADAGG